jgi:adenylate cyclase
VSDAALATCVNSARGVLGDSGNTQRLLKTIPRKGFRFGGHVTVAGRSAGPDALSPRTPFHADKPSIVVMPFRNVSGADDQEHIADAITDDIITELARSTELFVIASNSSVQYKERRSTLGKLARSWASDTCLRAGFGGQASACG